RPAHDEDGRDEQRSARDCEEHGATHCVGCGMAQANRARKGRSRRAREPPPDEASWRMPRTAPLVLALASLLSAHAALADTQVLAPAGGGLAPLDVRVSLADATVVAGGMRMHIELDRAQFPADKDVT